MRRFAGSSQSLEYDEVEKTAMIGDRNENKPVRHTQEDSMERVELLHHNSSSLPPEMEVELVSQEMNRPTSGADELSSPLSNRDKKKYLALIADENWDTLQSYIQNCRPTHMRYITHSLMDKTQQRSFFRRIGYSPWLVQYCHNLHLTETANCLEWLRLSVAKEVFRMIGLSYRLELVRNVSWKSLIKLLALIGEDEWNELDLFSRYPSGSIAQKMQPLYNVIVLESSDTLEEGLQQLKELNRYSETSPYLFLVDEQRKYEGVISWSNMVTIAACSNVELQSNTLGSFADRGRTLTPDNTVSELQNLVREERTFSAMVVDKGTDMPLGFVNSAAILDIFADPHESPVLGFEGLDVSFSASPIVLLYRKRIFWLLLLVLINVGTAYIIGSFESQLKRHVVLASFIPLLTGMGGNTGSQAAALIIQSLAAKDIVPSDYFRALKKEMLVGLLLAFTLAVAGWILGYIRGNSDVAWIVAIALACIVILSNFVGYTLPFVAKVLSIDPAAISGPMVTTLIDMAGVTIFFCTSLFFLQEV